MKNKSIIFILSAMIIFYSCEKIDLDDYLKEKELIQVPTENGKLVETGIVDLGLSVKWAACNLDANSTDHFVSNCSESGSAFNWSVPTTVNVESLEEIGGTELDNATNLLGPGWRTPSELEFNELRSKCRWDPINYKGTYGALITGPSGKAIFLPENYYWLSTATTYCSFYFDGSFNRPHSYDKFYIRPVYGSLK